jgi:hypothetical protein
MNQIYFILTNLKYEIKKGYVSYSKRENNKPQISLAITNTSDINRLTKDSLKFSQIPENRHNRTTLKDEKGFLQKIEFVTKINNSKPVVVYNLEVEEDNSYVVENQVVHNCDAIVAFGHAITHLYKEKNYTVKVNDEKEKTSLKKITESFSNVFGIKLAPKVKRSMI